MPVSKVECVQLSVRSMKHPFACVMAAWQEHKNKSIPILVTQYTFYVINPSHLKDFFIRVYMHSFCPTLGFQLKKTVSEYRLGPAKELSLTNIYLYMIQQFCVKDCFI